jgi:parallel beta-helix repeat protein
MCVSHMKKQNKPKFRIISYLLLLGIFIIIMITPVTNASKILYVDDNGFFEYTKIQDAIDNTTNGDTVYVYSGTYYENIVINKTINLVGDKQKTTIIDGKEKDTVIKLNPESNNVNITGFTIQNSGYEYYRSGIDINSDKNHIAGNTIKGCRYGISLDLWAHNCIVNNNTFTQNTYGVFVYSVTPNNNLIYHNNFIDNYLGAYDDSNSIWNLNSKGNYWDDFNGTDDNNDGIGDTAYNIPGGSAKDQYPLMKPVETPGFEILLTMISILVIIRLKKKK